MYKKIRCRCCNKITIPVSGSQKFCLSNKCQKIKKDKQRKNERLAYLQKNKISRYKKCLICNNKFLFQKHKKFCSKKCYYISLRKKYHETKKEYTPKFIEKKCIFCGKKIKTIYPNQKYCSIKCGKSNKLNSRIRFWILKRDKFTCQYCGKKAPNVILHIDHIIPKSKSGSNNKKNLITACVECNLGKSNVL